jgi:hypothetical protein
MVVAGTIDHQLLLIAILVVWAGSKMTITMKRQINQARFVRKEIRSPKTGQTSVQSRPAAQSTSNEITSHGTPIDISANQQDEIQTSGYDKHELNIQMNSHV